MNTRIPVDRLPPTQNGQSSQPLFQDWHDLGQKQIADRLRQVEAYVHEHPVTGIGAAFFIGMFLGWASKRR